ncbi:MAG TPA: hypothetical protein VFH68_08460 [Polyangia bacterium]|nr:hypothetical protein [Polyangia bacterium]
MGTGGINAIHDVVLVQLILKTLKNSHQASYFGSPYTNGYSGETARAIAAFQADQNLIGGPNREIQGLAKAGSATWLALRAAFTEAAPPYVGARTTKGLGLAYLPMPQARMGESIGEIHAAKNLQPNFRLKVVQLVQTFYQQSSIAWSMVPKTGGWRSFAGQEGLSSDAGYGESIHHYGYAVDLVVLNFSWIAADLQVRKSPIRLDGMAKVFVDQLHSARNLLATSLKVYKTTMPGDEPHLQNFDDDPLDSVASLMALMHAVGPKAMNWKPRYRKPTDYLCDLGLGGDYYFVGTAIDIWEQDPAHHISAADLAKALQAKKKADEKFSVSNFLGRSSEESKIPPGPGDISSADIKAVQKMLRAEFDAAAAKWALWKPVYYPDNERRPPNPVKRAKR